MKKLITLTLGLILAVNVLTACGSKEQKQPVTTTTHSTAPSVPTIESTAPTSETTHPSTIPDSGSMPNNGNTDDNESHNDETTSSSERSRIHAPSIVNERR